MAGKTLVKANPVNHGKPHGYEFGGPYVYIFVQL